MSTLIPQCFRVSLRCQGYLGGFHAPLAGVPDPEERLCTLCPGLTGTQNCLAPTCWHLASTLAAHHLAPAVSAAADGNMQCPGSKSPGGGGQHCGESKTADDSESFPNSWTRLLSWGPGELHCWDEKPSQWNSCPIMSPGPSSTSGGGSQRGSGEGERGAPRCRPAGAGGPGAAAGG